MLDFLSKLVILKYYIPAKVLVALHQRYRFYPPSLAALKSGFQGKTAISMSASQIVLIAFVVLFTAIAALWDARTRKLPNFLTVPAFALGIIFHMVSGGIIDGWWGVGYGLLFSLGGFAFGFSALFLLWIMGSSAGGDVKMMGALGAWLGFKLTLIVFLTSAFIIVLGMLALVLYRLFTKGYGSVRRQVQSAKNRSGRRGKPQPQQGWVLPFGVPLALATWLVLGFGVISNLYGG